MPVATTPVEVGVRDLKNNLSRYLDRVSDGLEIVVTERGRPVARLLRIDEPADRLADLIAAGLVRPPRTRDRRLAPAHPRRGLGERPRRRPAPVITYVDASVLIKILIDEPGTTRPGACGPLPRSWRR